MRDAPLNTHLQSFHGTTIVEEGGKKHRTQAPCERARALQLCRGRSSGAIRTVRELCLHRPRIASTKHLQHHRGCSAQRAAILAHVDLLPSQYYILDTNCMFLRVFTTISFARLHYYYYYYYTPNTLGR